MRIFHSKGSDPMLLGSRAQLDRLHDTIQVFLSSSSVALELPAKQDGDPTPYEALLPGLRIRKTTGPIVLSQLATGWLALEGSVANLGRYASYLYFRPEETSGHHHPENCNAPGYISQTSMNLIIEADSTWGTESAA
jgi:hypothetical protein